MFDKTDLEAFEINSSTFYVTQTTGETLFAFFNIVAILISLNMLIAMMSNSFQHIAVSTNILGLVYYLEQLLCSLEVVSSTTICTHR